MFQLSHRFPSKCQRVNTLASLPPKHQQYKHFGSDSPPKKRKVILIIRIIENPIFSQSYLFCPIPFPIKPYLMLSFQSNTFLFFWQIHNLTSTIPKCQILGLTRGSGILHIESMLAHCNM